MPDTSSRTGKIARLPLELREEVCRRLLDGQKGKQICAWLNGREDVLAILAAHFNGVPVDENNLSQWRQGGYRDWLNHRENLEQVQQRSRWALEVAQTGQDIFGGAAVVVGGKIADLMEGLDIRDQRLMLSEKPENLVGLVQALARLKNSDIAARNHALRMKQHATLERRVDIEERRFEDRMVREFVKYFDDRRAREIMAGKGDRGVKMEQLVELMFGRRPELTPASELGLESPELVSATPTPQE